MRTSSSGLIPRRFPRASARGLPGVAGRDALRRVGATEYHTRSALLDKRSCHVEELLKGGRADRGAAVVGRLFEVKPGACTGIHHHGEQQTIAYVLSGICEVRWGTRGEYAARAKAGDFIHVPAFLPHMEINPSDSEPFHWFAAGQ